jgi:hypothetical protein
MSNKNVKELVKNVIEENAVAFKANLNRTLYSKVGQKLQEKYIEVSRKLFYNLNEVSGSEAAPANDNPYLQPGGPDWRLPPGYEIPEKTTEKAPTLPPPRPDPRGFPKGSQDLDYQKAWYEYYLWWQQQDKKWKEKNPMPPPPMTKGNPPTQRPGGGTLPGTGSRPIR